jgi:hypothetical protein
MKKKSNKTCYGEHQRCGVACDKKDCRQWIDYEKDLNCTIVCVNNNGILTLAEAADRLGVSFVRVKQNQDQAMKKYYLAFKRLGKNIFNK